MALPEKFDLGEAYKQYFRMVPASSDSLKDEVYRIRHRVYCEEFAFEPQRANRRECDDNDAHSLHLLIRSIQTRKYIGCTRLVRARPTAPLHPLPFEQACADTLDRTLVDPSQLPRQSIAEVSRLAVLAQYRKRKRDLKRSPLPLSDTDFGTLLQPRFPFIPIGLYLGTVALARLHGIDTLFLLTERRLASHFQKLGVNIQRVGAPIEHRGTRVPSMINVSGIVRDMRPSLFPLYRVIEAELKNA